MALCQWPPTAAQAALWMQVLSMEGGRGLHASTANETVSLFSNFMADAKCRVLFQQGSLSYEEMLAAKADGRYSARVLAGQVFPAIVRQTWASEMISKVLFRDFNGERDRIIS